jgi:hypothetical protein
MSTANEQPGNGGDIPTAGAERRVVSRFLDMIAGGFTALAVAVGYEGQYVPATLAALVAIAVFLCGVYWDRVSRFLGPPLSNSAYRIASNAWSWLAVLGFIALFIAASPIIATFIPPRSLPIPVIGNEPPVAATTPFTTPELTAIAKLAALGWTVNPTGQQIHFQIDNTEPPFVQSAPYFKTLHRAFSITLQSAKGLSGLHNLADIQNLVTLGINNGTFTDISELQDFTYLQKLTISQEPASGGDIIDASPLASMINLKDLSFGTIRLNDLRPLAHLRNLETLQLGQALTLDLSPLGLSSISTLRIASTRDEDLGPLKDDIKLRALHITQAQLPFVTKLATLPELREISISGTSTGYLDLAPIGTLIGVEKLSIFGINRLNLTPISKLVNLRELDIMAFGFNGLARLDNAEALAQLSELRILSVGWAAISQMDFISGLSKLTKLSLIQMPLQSIQGIQNDKAITTVTLNFSTIIDISPLLELPQLTEVSVVGVPARADVITELERRGIKVVR